MEEEKQLVTGKIEFNLDDQYARIEMKQCLNIANYICAIDEIRGMLRTHWKYGDYEEKTAEIVEKIWDSFHEILDDRNVNPDEE